MKDMTNVAGMREDALRRLRKLGSQRMSDVELWLAGHAVGVGVAEEVRDATFTESHPLVRAASFELEVLEVGKWEWLYAWLSPDHLAMKLIPGAMVGVAKILLGYEQLSEQEWQEITCLVHELP